MPIINETLTIVLPLVAWATSTIAIKHFCAERTALIEKEAITVQSSYRGYHTTIRYSPEDDVFYGKIDGIRDLVNFHSPSPNGAVKEFRKAAKDYLIFCREIKRRQKNSRFIARLHSVLQSVYLPVYVL